LGATNTVSLDRELCAEILSKLHLKQVPVRWSCAPFRTGYYSAPEAFGPHRWRVVWTISIEVDRAIAEIPRRRYECFEINAGGGYSIAPVEEAMSLEYRGIADFQHEQPAEAALAEIQRQLRPSVHGWSFPLDDQFVQLVVTLGPFGPDKFLGQFELGERIEGIMRAHGGIPNKTEREDTWDIVFNEDGTE
jgi:hypothetical protein